MRSPKLLAVLRIHTFSTQTVKKGIIIKKNNPPPHPRVHAGVLPPSGAVPALMIVALAFKNH